MFEFSCIRVTVMLCYSYYMLINGYSDIFESDKVFNVVSILNFVKTWSYDNNVSLIIVNVI